MMVALACVPLCRPSTSMLTSSAVSSTSCAILPEPFASLTVSLGARSRRRKAILKQFRSIWQAKGSATLLRRYRRVVRQFRSSQPDAVATLRRNFRHTIGFFHILRKHPDWQTRFLRTTSRLERFNRSLRRRTRIANAFHSDAGLIAMLAYEIALFNA